MACRREEAGGTRVQLADLVAVRPAVVPLNGLLVAPEPGRWLPVSRGVAGIRVAAASTNFLLILVFVVLVFVCS